MYAIFSVIWEPCTSLINTKAVPLFCLYIPIQLLFELSSMCEDHYLYSYKSHSANVKYTRTKKTCYRMRHSLFSQLPHMLTWNMYRTCMTLVFLLLFRSMKLAFISNGRLSNEIPFIFIYQGRGPPLISLSLYWFPWPSPIHFPHTASLTIHSTPTSKSKDDFFLQSFHLDITCLAFCVLEYSRLIFCQLGLSVFFHVNTFAFCLFVQETDQILPTIHDSVDSKRLFEWDSQHCHILYHLIIHTITTFHPDEDRL